MQDKKKELTASDIEAIKSKKLTTEQINNYLNNYNLSDEDRTILNYRKGNLLQNVKNVTETSISKADLEEISKKIQKDKDIPEDIKDLNKETISLMLKSQILKDMGKRYYNVFKDMSYDELVQHCKQVKGPNGAINLSVSLPVNADVGEEIGTYPTSFEISPNSFWANVTNILNKVSVGDNMIGFGESFNAYEFFKSEDLQSGQAKLVTQGYTISGTCLLNQNSLVPESTQMLKGYQASLGVFINTSNPQAVGGGTGIGLFNLYATPINVMKLAVTEPQQFTQMVKIFYATAVNSKAYTLWMICNNNFLTNINNYIVDNQNTNLRNCLNGTLFPAIKIMENPTNEFNLGILSQSNGTTINYDYMMNTGLDNITTPLTRYAYLQSDYLVSGSQTYPRIQECKRDEIHLIVSPKFYVALKSGTLSELFHWEFQNLDSYVLPENIHMLYKKVNIQAAEMNTTITSSGKYPFQTLAPLGDRWLPDNAIVLFTKPSDSNNWSAQYGNVWTTEMSNEWGAGMIKTAYLQYAIWGGVIPWSNGCVFYFKNLLNVVSDGTAQTDYDFSLTTYTAS